MNQATWCQRTSMRLWLRSRPSAPSSSLTGASAKTGSGKTVPKNTGIISMYLPTRIKVRINGVGFEGQLLGQKPSGGLYFGLPKEDVGFDLSNFFRHIMICLLFNCSGTAQVPHGLQVWHQLPATHCGAWRRPGQGHACLLHDLQLHCALAAHLADIVRLQFAFAPIWGEHGGRGQNQYSIYY